MLLETQRLAGREWDVYTEGISKEELLSSGPPLSVSEKSAVMRYGEQSVTDAAIRLSANTMSGFLSATIIYS